MSEYLTPRQAAEKFPYGNTDWVRRQLQSGRLRGSRIGGRWVTTEEAIREMVEAASNSTARPRRRRAS